MAGMSDVKAKVIWTGGEAFRSFDSAGVETRIDGRRQGASSPVDLVLEAIGACSAIDVVLILERMRTPAARLEVELDADRHATPPRYLTRVRARFEVWGDGIRPEKVSRAINLSLTKYCSVYQSLRPDIELAAEFRLHPASASEAAGQYHRVTIDPAISD
jgi:putative redox protein